MNGHGMSCIILTGGKGTRLQPMTLKTPKPMLKIAGVPHLEQQVLLAKQHGFSHIIFSAGYLHEQIINYFGDGTKFGVHIEYALDGEKPLGTAGAIKNCESLIRSKNFMVMNGDILTDISLTDALKRHKELNLPITITLVPVDDPSRFGVVLTHDDGTVKQFLEKPKNPPSNFINAGIYIMNKSVLQDIPAGEYKMVETDVFPQYAKEGKLNAFKSKQYWVDIGTPAKYVETFYDIANKRIEVPRLGMSDQLKFGTDGWRGVMGDDYNFTNVYRIARGFGRLMLEEGKSRVLIGYDQRFLSKEFAELTGQVLAGMGLMPAITREVTPTPVVSFNVKHYGYDYGIMITASHNPNYYNGFKIKTAEGGSATPDITTRVARYANEVHTLSKLLHKPVPVLEVRAAYRAQIASLVNLDELANINKVNHYAMTGATLGWLRGFVPANELGAKTDHLEPIDKYLTPLKEVCSVNHLIGIANDGDGDRIGVVDEAGNYVDAAKVYALVLLHLIKHRGLTGKVVKTLTTSQVIDNICAKHNIPCETTPVGFKYIYELMLQGDVMMGGEESGGIGYGMHVPERDGILTALLLLEYVSKEHKSLKQLLEELEAEYGKFDYHRVDLENVTEGYEELLAKLPEAYQGITPIDIDGRKFVTEDGWFMLRKSGTEPLLRIYAESKSGKAKDVVNKLVERLK